MAHDSVIDDPAAMSSVANPPRLRGLARSAPWGVFAVAAIVFAASVWYTIWAAGAMGGGMAMPGGWTMSMMWMQMPSQSIFGAGIMFLAMWTAMMVAMMLPSAMPLILIYRRVMRFQGAVDGAIRSVLMIGSYFAVWCAFGLVTFVIGFSLGQLAMRSAPISRALPWLGGVCLIVCGIYQFTRWKSSCLHHCRDPMMMVAEHLQGGWPGAIQLGTRLGMSCAICCWSLMVIQMVLGIMNLVVMAAIALVITMEKLLPGGSTVARAVGAIAAGWGILEIVRAG